jgi:hypothetical protein
VCEDQSRLPIGVGVDDTRQPVIRKRKYNLITKLNSTYYNMFEIYKLFLGLKIVLRNAIKYNYFENIKAR